MRNLLLLSALCLGVSATAHADTVFHLFNNTYGTVSSDGLSAVTNGSAVGTINIDTVLGQVNFIDVTVSEGGSDYLFSGTPDGGGLVNNNTQYDAYISDATGVNVLLFDLPVSSLVGYMGGDLCSFNNLCSDGQGRFFAGYVGLPDGNFAAITGSLVTTPEPSSIVLLGTGLAGAVGAMRRRLLARGA